MSTADEACHSRHQSHQHQASPLRFLKPRSTPHTSPKLTTTHQHHASLLPQHRARTLPGSRAGVRTTPQETRPLRQPPLSRSCTRCPARAPRAPQEKRPVRQHPPLPRSCSCHATRLRGATQEAWPLWRTSLSLAQPVQQHLLHQTLLRHERRPPQRQHSSPLLR